ncbi:MAG: guanylate kinase [Planctomycetes bacterium]|nr:guanylate kinase [Planctomycetota bacterium]
MSERIGPRGKMLVISGPSGSGKTTICKRLLEDPRVKFSVSATTRAPRTGEVDGRDYHFITKERFRDMIARGAFIEHAEVFGNMYGTPREPMEQALAEGLVYLLEIDVQGALQLKALGVEGVYVFIAPPDFEELRRRLVTRRTDAPEVIERRLKKAEDEYRERVKYDHVVVNDDLERAVGEVRRLVGLD